MGFGLVLNAHPLQGELTSADKVRTHLQQQTIHTNLLERSVCLGLQNGEVMVDNMIMLELQIYMQFQLVLG